MLVIELVRINAINRYDLERRIDIAFVTGPFAPRVYGSLIDIGIEIMPIFTNKRANVGVGRIPLNYLAHWIPELRLGVV